MKGGLKMQGKYRHELKYDISYGEYLILRPRLKAILNVDPHTDESGHYQIHSIYFDNYHDKALREKINGVLKREKYRIRWYNDDQTHLTLEKKMKINDLCMKFGKPMTAEQLHKIMDGNYHFLMESDGFGYVIIKCSPRRKYAEKNNNSTFERPFVQNL